MVRESGSVGGYVRLGCGRWMADEYTIEQHFTGVGPDVLALYERLIEIVEGCGPFSYAVSKTAITFKGTRRGFAGTKLRRKYLGGYLDVTPEIDDPRIVRVEPYTKRLFFHTWRVDRLDQMDDEFERWISEAYAVGNGAHLDN